MTAKMKKPLLVLSILISLAVVIVSYAAAPASRPISNIFEISDQTNNLNYPAADEFLGAYDVVWCNDGSTYKWIEKQTISKFGELTGSMSAVSPADAKRCKPDIAFGVGSIRYLVVYEYDDGVHRPDIRGVQYNPGSPPMPEITLGTGTALRSRYNPAVAYSTMSNKWLVVWESHVQGNLSTDIEGQLINESGYLSGTNFLIATGDSNYSYDQPDVAYNPARNEFLVVWRRENKSDSHTNILGKRVATNGTIVDTSEIIIGWYTVDEENPAVAGVYTSGGGLYLVTWEFIYGPDDHDIYAHLIDGNGNPDVDDIYVAATPDNETKPAVATNGFNFLVSWTGEFWILGFPFTGAFARPVSYSGDLLFNQEWIGGIFTGETALTRGWNGDYLAAMDAFDAVFWSWDIWGRLWGNRIDLPFVTR